MDMSKHVRKRLEYVKSIIVQYHKRRETPEEALCGLDKREYNAVHAAVDLTERMENGLDRLKVVDMTLWRGTHTLAGAAMEVYQSERTARRWRSEFVKMVEQIFSLIFKNWPF